MRSDRPKRTRSPQWQRRPGQRRDELLDAALKLFRAGGVAETTVAEITDAAGVAKGSFYRYFSSKDEMLSALKARFFAEMAERAVEVVALDPTLDLLGMLDVGISVAVRYLCDNADLLGVWNQVEDPVAAYQDTARGLGGFATLYEAAITEGVAAGEFDCADPAQTARLIVYGIQGAVTATILDAGARNPDRMIAAAVDLHHRALGVRR